MNRRHFCRALITLGAAASTLDPLDLFQGHSPELTSADINWGFHGLLDDGTFRCDYLGINRVFTDVFEEPLANLVTDVVPLSDFFPDDSD